MRLPIDEGRPRRGHARARGMFDDTKRYVDNVVALQSRFGG